MRFDVSSFTPPFGLPISFSCLRYQSNMDLSPWERILHSMENTSVSTSPFPVLPSLILPDSGPLFPPKMRATLLSNAFQLLSAIKSHVLSDSASSHLVAYFLYSLTISYPDILHPSLFADTKMLPRPHIGSTTWSPGLTIHLSILIEIEVPVTPGCLIGHLRPNDLCLDVSPILLWASIQSCHNLSDLLGPF